MARRMLRSRLRLLIKDKAALQPMLSLDADWTRAVDENIKNMNQLFEKAEKVWVSKSEVALFAAINGIGSLTSLLRS